ncbi:MAG: septal ring lytic transglycosylase RlpA family protein [Acidobacteriaceae bacterium]
MRTRIAQSLAMLLLVGLGAAQGPGKAGENHKSSVGRVASNQKSKPYQAGTASWYGAYFQGRETANGENYDMYDMTAAHRTLPLGTFVRVTNLENRRAVVVRINDRGPYVGDRIIDLSYNAARSLDFKDKGLQKVRIDVVHPRDTASMMAPALLRPASYQR